MVESLLFAFFAINTGYVCVLSLAGRYYAKRNAPVAPQYNRIAVLVPCYKEDAVILSTARQLLQLDYPHDRVDVIIIADSLQPDTLEQLGTSGVTVLPVTLRKSMKSRSLNYALQSLPGPYDIAIIADADNVLARNFLQEVNNLYSAGYTVIQAQRVPKNRTTAMALLDGLSEGINNYLYRQGSNALGLSAALSGSGMVFPYGLLKECLAGIDSPVEDKALQQVLAEKGHHIHYQKDILVFDEKVESPEAYRKQRTRWIAGQYQMLRQNFFKGIKLLLRGNVNFFNIAILHNLLPSRINSLIALFILAPLFTMLYFNESAIVFRWWTITLLYVLALAHAAPKVFYSRKMLRSFSLLPVVVIRTLQAVALSTARNKGFIHTTHKQTEVEM